MLFPTPEEGERLLDELCEHYSVSKDDIFKRGRKGFLSNIRKIYILYLFEELNWSKAKIARRFGFDTDRSIVYNALNTVNTIFSIDETTLMIYHRAQKKFKPILVVRQPRVYKAKTVSQYTPNGREIKIWESAAIAARNLKITPSAIYQAIRKNDIVSKSRWKYTKEV